MKAIDKKDVRLGTVVMVASSVLGVFFGVVICPEAWLKLANKTNTFSFSGQLDEVRISNVRRYSGQQVFLSTSPFIFDGNTLLLLHFNQANGNPVVESILPNISATNYGITYVNHIVVPTPEPTRVLDRGNVGGPVSSPTGTQ